MSSLCAASLTSNVRVSLLPSQKATWMSTISCGSPNVYSIWHGPSASTAMEAHVHMDQLSLAMPSRVFAGAHSPSLLGPQPKTAEPVAETPTSVLVPTSTAPSTVGRGACCPPRGAAAAVVVHGVFLTKARGVWVFTAGVGEVGGIEGAVAKQVLHPCGQIRHLGAGAAVSAVIGTELVVVVTVA